MPDQDMKNQAPPPECYDYADDEINLLDLFLVLLRYKWLILLVVFVAGLLAVLVSLSMTDIYRSAATIAPTQAEQAPRISSLTGFGVLEGFLGIGGGGSLNNLEVVLNSRELSRRIVEKYSLMPILFEKEWDAEKKTWRTDKTPTKQDGTKQLKGMLVLSSDKKNNILEVAFEHKDPVFAKQMVESYLTELSEILRETTLNDAQEKAAFLQEELSRTSDVLLKEKIAALLAGEIEKMTFARVQKYYSFKVIDPPLVPDLNKKVKPKRSQICILTVVVAFFLAVFLAFFLEFIRNIRANADPGQIAKLNTYLGRKKSS
jgi:uncharacterized protein involved in exopolysaccharide biosynthesis